MLTRNFFRAEDKVSSILYFVCGVWCACGSAFPDPIVVSGSGRLTKRLVDNGIQL